MAWQRRSIPKRISSLKFPDSSTALRFPWKIWTIVSLVGGTNRLREQPLSAGTGGQQMHVLSALI